MLNLPGPDRNWCQTALKIQWPTGGGPRCETDKVRSNYAKRRRWPKALSPAEPPSGLGKTGESLSSGCKDHGKMTLLQESLPIRLYDL